MTLTMLLSQLRLKRTRKLFVFQIKRSYNTANEPRLENILDHSDILFKKLFGNNSLNYFNILYLIVKFFNIDLKDIKKFATKDLKGSELFFRLLLNPYYNVQDQADFDKVTQFFKTNLVYFNTLGLLLCHAMNFITNSSSVFGKANNKPDVCSGTQLNFYFDIKDKIVNEFSNFKESSSFYFDKKVSQTLKKDYDPVLTLQKLLPIIMEINLFLTHKHILISAGDPYLPMVMNSYHPNHPEAFFFYESTKPNVPYLKMSPQEFRTLYESGSHLIQTSFSKQKQENSIPLDLHKNLINPK